MSKEFEAKKRAIHRIMNNFYINGPSLPSLRQLVQQASMTPNGSEKAQEATETSETV